MNLTFWGLSMSELSSIDQHSIAVDVDYYNEDEEKKLLTYPSAKEIRRIVTSGLEIPTSEFLTYYLFHRKRPGKLGLRSYRDIESKISRAIADLESFVQFNGKSISVPKDVGSQIPHITEYVGESIGLSVVNRIHNLTEADWDKIRESKGPHAKPTLDYQHGIAASDGERIIQVETKGSCVQDNRKKSEAIWSHKANIVNKKCEIRNLAENGAYPYPADVRYGTIAAVDFRTDGTVRCWLLDPDSGETDISPESFRLLSRIRFLRDWISFLGPRSQLATSMATRVAALESLDNPFQLDGVPLRKGNNELFEIVPFHLGAALLRRL